MLYHVQRVECADAVYAALIHYDTLTVPMRRRALILNAGVLVFHGVELMCMVRQWRLALTMAGTHHQFYDRIGCNNSSATRHERLDSVTIAFLEHHNYSQ